MLQSKPRMGFGTGLAVAQWSNLLRVNTLKYPAQVARVVR